MDGNFTFNGLNTGSTAPAAEVDTVTAPATDNAESPVDLKAMTEGVSNTTPDATPEAKAEGNKAEGNVNEAPVKRPAWMAQLPEDLREDEAFTSFEKLGDFAKAYKEAVKKEGIKAPGKDATPEELAAFYKAIGKPETAEDYKLEGTDLDAFKEMAFGSNLTQSQAESVLKALKARADAAANTAKENMARMYNETNAALKTEYGNSYTEKMKSLNRGLLTFGGKNIQQKLMQAGLSYDPDIVHMFIRLGELSSEAGGNMQSSTGDAYKTNAAGGQFSFSGLK